VVKIVEKTPEPVAPPIIIETPSGEEEMFKLEIKHLRELLMKI
jgi:endonuclease IV